jgi:hypothetical protein
MPKFVLRCTTRKSFHLTVEAPSVESVRAYYEAVGYDEGEFLVGDGVEHTLDKIELLPDSASCPAMDIRVDASGKVIRK